MQLGQPAHRFWRHYWRAHPTVGAGVRWKKYRRAYPATAVRMHRKSLRRARLGQLPELIPVPDLMQEIEIETAPAPSPSPTLAPAIAKQWSGDDWMALFDGTVAGPAMIYRGLYTTGPKWFNIGFTIMGTIITVRGIAKLRERWL